MLVASFLLISLLLVVFLWYRYSLRKAYSFSSQVCRLCYSPYQVFKSVGISHPPVTPFIGNILQITRQVSNIKTPCSYCLIIKLGPY